MGRLWPQSAAPTQETALPPLVSCQTEASRNFGLLSYTPADGRIDALRMAQARGSDLTFAIDQHPAGTAITDSADGTTVPFCGLPGGNGLRVVPGRWREQHGWDTQLTYGNRSVSARSVAEGKRMLGDTRVLIVDDSALYRDFLAGVVVAHGMVNPGVAWDLPSLITEIGNTNPRVILLNMATRDNTTLLRQALTLNPIARVIVLGLSEDDEQEIVACAEAGVAGYHLRTESLEELLVLIGKVAGGESLCSPRVSAILLRRLSALASQRQSSGKELVLTAREAQILKMLEIGLSNREIAERVHRSSYGQEPCAQLADQAGREHPRPGRSPIPYRLLHRG